MNLRTRATELRELMDDPQCDAVRLDRTLERFALMNRLVAGWGRVYRRHLRPRFAAASPGRTFRVLDVGCGGGDVLRHVLARMQRDGFRAEGIGIDPDARAIAVAERRPDPRIAFLEERAEDLAAAGETFDVVLSNHVLHHLPVREMRGFFEATAALTDGVAIHSDLRRGRLPYALYAGLVTPLAPGTFLRVDGLRSIRRSYREQELARQLPPGWRVLRAAPFRLLAVHESRLSRV